MNTESETHNRSGRRGDNRDDNIPHNVVVDVHDVAVDVPNSNNIAVDIDGDIKSRQHNDIAFILSNRDAINSNASGMKELLLSLRKRHVIYAAMNSKSAKISATRSTAFSITVIIIGAISTIAANGIEQVIDTSWTIVFMQVMSSIMIAITAIDSLINYAKKSVLYSDVKKAHLHAVDLIDIALVSDKDSEDNIKYDYTGILKEIQTIHNNLRNNSLEILPEISKLHPEYE
jgi:hypothetical protein